MRTPYAILALSIFFLTAGCELDPEPKKEKTKKEEVKTATIQEVVAAERARSERCNYSDAIYVITEGQDPPQDSESAYYALQQKVVEDAIAAGDTELDAEKAYECVQSYNDTACGDSLSRVCAEYLVGLRAFGADCANDYTCSPGLYCKGAADECGECVAELALGADCDLAEFIPCAKGMQCVLNDDQTETCNAEGEVGADCPCIPGLQCIDEECVELYEKGESCSVGNCKVGLACQLSGMDFLCTDRGESGANCESSNDCVAGLECIGITAQLEATCQVPAVGLKCDPGDYIACGNPNATGFVCIEDANDDTVGTCQLVVAAALGESCDEENTYCVGYFTTSHCNAFVCEERPGLGQECPDGECKEGAVCDQSQVTSVCIALPGQGELCPSGDCEIGFGCLPDPNNNNEFRCLEYDPNAICAEEVP